MAGHNGFIAGGCFKNILNGDKFKDVDIFFHNDKDFEDAVELFSGSSYNQRGWALLYKNERVVAFKNSNTNIVVELVCTIYGTPSEVINKFDFSITKMAYYKHVEQSADGESITYKLIGHEDFFEHLHSKRLVLDGDIPFPVSTFNRSFKYSKYGYSLCNESIGKLIESLQGVYVEEDTVFYASNGWD